MQPFFADVMQRFEDLHRDFVQAIAGVPQEGLDWVPGADMNSLCVLVVHTMGSARFWVGDMAMLEVSNRNRDAEFAARGLNEAQLKDKIISLESYLKVAFERLTLDDLSKPRSNQPNFPQREFTVGWALLHALEHTGLHVGHAQITRQLWDQRR